MLLGPGTRTKLEMTVSSLTRTRENRRAVRGGLIQKNCSETKLKVRSVTEFLEISEVDFIRRLPFVTLALVYEVITCIGDSQKNRP